MMLAGVVGSQIRMVAGACGRKHNGGGPGRGTTL
jgi:hypothetical protein